MGKNDDILSQAELDKLLHILYVYLLYTRTSIYDPHMVASGHMVPESRSQEQSGMVRAMLID